MIREGDPNHCSLCAMRATRANGNDTALAVLLAEDFANDRDTMSRAPTMPAPPEEP